MTVEGKTNHEGLLEAEVPADAVSGTLTFFPTEESEKGIELTLEIGTLGPIEEEDGVRARLANLGHAPGDDADGLKLALKRFQGDYALEQTGQADEETLRALRLLHP